MKCIHPQSHNLDFKASHRWLESRLWIKPSISRLNVPKSIPVPPTKLEFQNAIFATSNNLSVLTPTKASPPPGKQNSPAGMIPPSTQSAIIFLSACGCMVVYYVQIYLCQQNPFTPLCKHHVTLEILSLARWQNDRFERTQRGVETLTCFHVLLLEEQGALSPVNWVMQHLRLWKNDNSPLRKQHAQKQACCPHYVF